MVTPEFSLYEKTDYATRALYHTLYSYDFNSEWKRERDDGSLSDDPPLTTQIQFFKGEGNSMLKCLKGETNSYIVHFT